MATIPAFLSLLSLVLLTAPTDPVRIFAAASLTDALQAVGRLQATPRLVFQFGASNDLARQIRAGAPADLFFSADSRQMDALQSAGLIEVATRRDVLSNQLVLVVPKASPLSLSGPQDLTRPEIRSIAIADPAAVPAGVYARAYLERLSLWSQLERRLIPTLDVRAALAAVGAGNADAGFVYRTDAALSERVRVLYQVPLDEGPRIVYPLAALRGRLTPAVERVLDSLFSEAARDVFQKQGFIVLSLSPP